MPLHRQHIDAVLAQKLLVALDALLAERSVTRAADRLGLSQPGMSNTLARLRKLFGDPTACARGPDAGPDLAG